MMLEHIASKNLDLVSPQRRFAPDLRAYGSDPEFCRFIDAKPHRSDEDAADFIEMLLRENSTGRRMYWIAVDKQDGRAIGTLGLLFPIASHHRVAEFGYGFARQCWGKGVFQEAAQAVLSFAFRRLDLARIQALTRADNVASIRGVEKLGFRREAVLRSFYQGANERIDAVLLALLSDQHQHEAPRGRH